ncbi:CocE/NonD family hydrolase [Paenibacillus sp. 7124]|uniref:CocE/NonD family hydrolase n=1 Tax=Paenibacillus apii TaxID=1850370 RepID=A0A6M1PTE3_9BACL|nr:CocE/NonD family hydrolase [Paenibacillus apii]NGM83521.1 CocE/NonD family hydrolase [Paenibacillus apii]
MANPLEKQMIAEFNVPVEMRDGIVLRANIYRPYGDGTWPVLLTRTPYGKDNVPYIFNDIPRAVKTGYVVIIQDTRGRFASEGDWDPILSANKETSDSQDTINWAAKLPYSNGQVGMFGISYYAFTQWAGMIQNPTFLKVAAPALSWSDPFDGLMYRGGAFELGLLSYWQLGMYLDTLSRLYPDEQERAIASKQLISDIDQLKTEIKGLPLKNFALFARNKVAPSILELFERGMDQDYVDALSLKGKYDKFIVPTLNIAGWYDIFLQGTIENFLQMRNKGGSPEARQSKLVIGPWQHLDHSHQAGEINFGLAAHSAFVDLVGLQLRWFDHFLKGRDTGIISEAPIKLFVMGENIWRDEYEWPLARTKFIPYYLHSQGHANTLQGDGVLSTISPDQEEPDHYTYDPLNPVITKGGAIMMPPDFNSGAFDQREIESRDDVLVYTTPVLEEDVEVTGPIKVKLWASSSALDTDFVARLVNVHPDGYAQNITDGIIRARFRNAAKGEAPSLIEPGKTYLYEIDLWSTSNLFKQGHRIRLDITSSNFPRWDRNSNTGRNFGEDQAKDVVVARQTIFHDAEHPSSIILPIIPRS